MEIKDMAYDREKWRRLSCEKKLLKIKLRIEKNKNKFIA